MNKFLRRTLAVFLLLFVSFSVYVVIINRNSKQMTVRQKILKAVYPAFIWLTKKSANQKSIASVNKTTPPVSFYSLKATAINGSAFDFGQLKGKKVLIVNTASDCGYTAQYDELEKLYNAYKDKLVIIAFPSNDFKDQEKSSDKEIEQFCKLNYGITFPLMQKCVVKKRENQQEVFKWLTGAGSNGWNSKQPEWNFSKYLVDEQGFLLNYFPPGISPLDKKITALIAE